MPKHASFGSRIFPRAALLATPMPDSDASDRKSYSYAEAGVSIAAGNALVKSIAPLVRATARPGADAEIGGFGAFFDPQIGRAHVRTPVTNAHLVCRLLL